MVWLKECKLLTEINHVSLQGEKKNNSLSIQTERIVLVFHKLSNKEGDVESLIK